MLEIVGYPAHWELSRTPRRDPNKLGGSHLFAYVDKRDTVEGLTLGYAFHGTHTRNPITHLDNMSGNVNATHTWILDSGVSHHMTYLPSILHNIK